MIVFLGLSFGTAGAMSFALLSLLGFEMDFGDENDGLAGGFFAIVVVIATAPIFHITATPIFHTAIPHQHYLQKCSNSTQTYCCPVHLAL